MTRRHLWLAVQGIGTLVLLALLLRRFDWAAFAALLGRMSPGFYVSSLLAVVFGQLLYAFRWQTVLRGMGITVAYPDVLRQYLIGIFFSNLMPTAIGGDAAKVYFLGRTIGYIEVGASVFVDRFLGVLWLAVFGALLAWSVGANSPLFVFNRNLLTVFALAFTTLLALVRLAPLDRLLEAKRWPGRVEMWIPRIREFAAIVRAGGCRVVTLAVSGAVTAGYVLLISLIYAHYFAENGAPAVSVPIVANIIVSMAIFVNIPISVNGIGLREQLHSMLFGTIGITKEVAVSLSLLVFAHMLLLSLVGWLLWFRLRSAAAGVAR